MLVENYSNSRRSAPMARAQFFVAALISASKIFFESCGWEVLQDVLRSCATAERSYHGGPEVVVGSALYLVSQVPQR